MRRPNAIRIRRAALGAGPRKRLTGRYERFDEARMTTVEFASGFLDLGDCGSLKIRGRSEGVITTASGERVDLPADVNAQITESVLWFLPAAGILLVIPRLGFTIYDIDLASGGCGEVDWMIREEDDPGLRHVEIQEPSDGGLLILYERGLIRLGSDLKVRWHILHDDVSAGLLKIDNNCATFVQQWPQDVSGRVRRFHLATGEENVC